MSFVAAAVQFEPILGEKKRNVEGLIRLSEEAIGEGAELVVLPEMGTTGYCWRDRTEVASMVEPIPGPTSRSFVRLARERDIWIVVGMPEVDPTTDTFYNSAVLVGPEGVVGVYRKTHAYVTEVRWARDGDLGLPVFDTSLGRLGILICMDAEYPEPARVLAIQDCDVVCFPTNWLGEKSPSAHWMTRAFENCAYWVAANRYGFERGVQFSGGSAVIGPDGSILDRIDTGDGLAMAEIDVLAARKERGVRLAQRRPALYPHVLLNSHLWPGAYAGRSNDATALDGIGPGAPPTGAQIGVIPASPAPHAEAEYVRHALAGHVVDLAVLPPLLRDAPLKVGSIDAVPRARRTIDSLALLSEELEVSLVTSVPWLEDDTLFEAVVLLEPDGSRTIHRCTSTDGDRQLWATPGNSPPPVRSTRFGLVGLLSGNELLAPEPARDLAARGAEILAVSADVSSPSPIALGATAVPLPAPSPTGPDSLHWVLPRVRAAENNAWLAFANRGTLPSGVFGPSFYRFPRREAVSVSGETVFLSLPDDAADRDRRTSSEKPYLRMRLPHLYGSLTARNEEDKGEGA